MVIFGSVRAGCDGRVGLPEGARGRETETRGCGRREGEKGRKLADESRSGSTRGKVVVRDQPSATAAIARLLLFLFLFLPFISLFLLFFPYLFYSPSDRTLLVLLPSDSLLLLSLFLFLSLRPPGLSAPLTLGIHFRNEKPVTLFGVVRWLLSQPLRRSY